MKWCGIAVVAAMLACSFGAAVAAEEERKEGVVQGSFVRLAEQKVGEQEYLAVLVKPADSEEPVMLLVPNRRTEQGQWVREPELAAAAGRLQAGQKLRVVWVAEGGQKFVRRIQAEGLGEGERRREGEGERRAERDRPAERREGERERPAAADVRELTQQIRAMRAAMERMQQQINELREEIRRLKGEKVERPVEREARRDKPAEAERKPDERRD